MDDTAAEAAFLEWLAGFKARHGDNLAPFFLRSSDLQEAFMAGVQAAEQVPQEKTFRLRPL